MFFEISLFVFQKFFFFIKVILDLVSFYMCNIVYVKVQCYVLVLGIKKKCLDRILVIIRLLMMWIDLYDLYYDLVNQRGVVSLIYNI